jgi:hypothetical protein
MKRIFLGLVLALIGVPASGGDAPPATDGSPQAAWVQYGPAGAVEIRAVADGAACPLLFLDLVQTPMRLRAEADGRFPTVCAAPLSPGTRQAALADGKYRVAPLPLPAPAPKRILVIGDGGCRIKGGVVQDCADPKAWPFAQTVAAAARLKPDLVIHVGDYPSREQPCPAGNAVCAGQPFGDDWQTWNADFFAPAAPLLAAAPFVFTRGNHEECSRNGAGFLRLLGPAAFDPAAPCAPHLAPFSVPLGALNLTVLDDAGASDQDPDPALSNILRSELEGLASASSPTWLVMHRPMFGAVSGPLGLPVGGNITLIAALPEGGIPSPVALRLSGHIHAFEVLNYGKKDRQPPQLIAGIGGDLLSDVPADLAGTIFQGRSGVRVADGLSVRDFGFVLMTEEGGSWRIDRYDPQGRIAGTCRFQDRRIACRKK